MNAVSFIVAGTGHRPNKLGGYAADNPMRELVKAAIAQELGWLSVEHPDLVVLSGMAVGFDQWLAEVAVALNIPFEAAVPFVGQEKKWPAEAQATYRALLAKAREVHIISPGDYSPEKMQRRNKWMVVRCQLLIALWDGSPGGTANCIAYAKRVRRSWQNLFDHPLLKRRK